MGDGRSWFIWLALYVVIIDNGLIVAVALLNNKNEWDEDDDEEDDDDSEFGVINYITKYLLVFCHFKKLDGAGLSCVYPTT